jgi:NAD(P)-dependent dehydrogenase (short-subunit alcohol dehydrogenase family)
VSDQVGSLAGRTVLITGASSGLGAHFSAICADAGANVVLCARRIERAIELAEQIGPQAMAVAMDVIDEASVIAGFDAAQSHFGTVETIIANAGISFSGRSIDVPVEQFREQLEVNITGAFLTAREGAKRLLSDPIAAARGRIVLVGSITAHMTSSGITAYSASKAAVANMGRNLAHEWARSGICVNVIQPGYIDTELAGDWFQTAAGREQIQSFRRKRLQPIDTLNGIISYLCSDSSGGTTGAVIDIDDGQSL